MSQYGAPPFENAPQVFDASTIAPFSNNNNNIAPPPTNAFPRFLDVPAGNAVLFSTAMKPPGEPSDSWAELPHHDTRTFTGWRAHVLGDGEELSIAHIAQAYKDYAYANRTTLAQAQTLPLGFIAYNLASIDSRDRLELAFNRLEDERPSFIAPDQLLNVPEFVHVAKDEGYRAYSGNSAAWDDLSARVIREALELYPIADGVDGLVYLLRVKNCTVYPLRNTVRVFIYLPGANPAVVYDINFPGDVTANKAAKAVVTVVRSLPPTNDGKIDSVDVVENANALLVYVR
jgi:hypothetical protein